MAYIGSSPKLKRVRYTPQSSAPSNPLEGDVFYSDGTALAEGLYVYKNSIWEAVGSDTGSSINYIDNPDAENSTTGWSTYDDGASAIPVDGTGGSPSTLTFTRNTSSPLRGVADFDLAKSAADGQGEGVSYDFSIDNADAYSILRVSFDYTVSANYADSDIGVYVYDITNSQLIRLSKEDLDATSLNGHFISEFQATDSTSYRLIFHVQSTNASAYSFNFDNVSVGPRISSIGAALTAYEEYTPQTSTTNGTLTNARYRRIGDVINIMIKWNTTTGFGGDVLTSDVLPAGLAFDKTKMVNASVTERGRYPIGRWHFADIGSNAYTGTLEYREDTGAITMRSAIGSSIPNPDSDTVTMYIEAPIVGWGASSSISSDFGSRLIAARASGNPASAAGGAPVIFPTSDYDETASYSVSTGLFTVPESGTYIVSGYVTSSNSTITLNIAKNGSTDISAGITDTNGEGNFYGEVKAVKGDTLSLEPSGTLDVASGFISFRKAASPKTLLGAETVAARYTTDNGQALQTADNTTAFVYEDKVFDTHNSYNSSTGVYSVPVSGVYTISASAVSATGTYEVANLLKINVLVNNTALDTNFFRITTTTSTTYCIQFCGHFNLVKGDQVKINAVKSGTAVNSVSGSFSIAKV